MVWLLIWKTGQCKNLHSDIHIKLEGLKKKLKKYTENIKSSNISNIGD